MNMFASSPKRTRTLASGVVRFWPLLSIVVAAALVLNTVTLGRIETVLSVTWAGVSWSPFVLMGGGVFGLAVLTRRRLPPYSLPFLMVGLLAAAMTALNLGFRGGSAGWALYGFCAFFLPALLCPVVAGFSPVEARRALTLVLFLAVALGLVASVSVLATIDVAGALGWDGTVTRGLSPVGGPIATGAILMLVWPWLLGSVVERGKTLSVLALGVVALGVMLSGSRLIVLSAGLSLVAAVALGWGRIRSVRMLLGVTLASVAVLLGALAIVQWSSQLPAGARILQLVSAASDGQRFQSLATGFQLILDSPLIGRGPGTAYPWMDPIWTVQGRPGMVPTAEGYSLVEPHNMYVMGSVEYGLVWSLLALGLLGIALGRVLRMGRRYPELTYAALGLVAFLVQSVGSSYLFVNPRVSMMFWVWLGACLAIERGLRRGAAAERESPVVRPPRGDVPGLLDPHRGGGVGVRS